VKEFRLLIQENKFAVAYGALATFTFFLFFTGTICLYFEVWPFRFEYFENNDYNKPIHRKNG